MSDEDIDRIIKMQLAPINISVQTTNPELRCKMLNNRFAGEKLKFLDRLYEGHVEMNGQIVCCKGVNDGEELRRSITDLMKYLPFMRSVSVVPAGITRYREGLYPIPLFTKEEAAEIIDMIESYQQTCYAKYKLHFIHASDEFYIMAERDFPEEERYDGYIQLENGVGMMRLLREEFEEALEKVTHGVKYHVQKHKLKRTITVATGLLAFSTLQDFASALMQAYHGLTIQVNPIRNDFFGETITVTGLITGQDLIAQLKKEQENGTDLGDTLLISAAMLRSGEQIFLDDVTIPQVEEALGLRVVVVESSGQDFVDAVLHEDYRMGRDNENFVYVKAYERE
jgi:putative radical SAM enzyme (TIGR03279 family)